MIPPLVLGALQRQHRCNHPLMCTSLNRLHRWLQELRAAATYVIIAQLRWSMQFNSINTSIFNVVATRDKFQRSFRTYFTVELCIVESTYSEKCTLFMACAVYTANFLCKGSLHCVCPVHLCVDLQFTLHVDRAPVTELTAYIEHARCSS